MSDRDKMTCVYCWKSKQYPDGFPLRHEARCWQCCWDQHIAANHRLPRSGRRKAKRRATRLVQARYEAAAETAWSAQSLLLELASSNPARPVVSSTPREASK